MGVYDRDYYREDSPGIRLGGAENWSAVVTLIVINVAVWVADMFTGNQWIADHFSTAIGFVPASLAVLAAAHVWLRARSERHWSHSV